MLQKSPQLFMSKPKARRQALNALHAFELFCREHSFGLPVWLASDYLNMTPQGVHQASERGWIAYFQHGRNRLYSYRDVIRCRWRSRKFKDNAPPVPYPAGARYDFDLVPETAATAKAPDLIDAHNANPRFPRGRREGNCGYESSRFALASPAYLTAPPPRENTYNALIIHCI
jgi:hypothetical protein